MTINGISGANMQAGQRGMNQATDSYSRNIQNQIANAQKQLQELSSNEEMPLEEKMKRRQEIRQQISDLNMQLRQHQMEQRKEKQQAKVHGSVATEMKGRANVLKAEIKQSGSTEAKEAELADLEQKAVNATASQMNKLAEVNKAASEAAAAERTKKKASDTKEEKAVQAEGKTEKTTDSSAKGEKAQDDISGADVQTENTENVQQDNGAQAQNIQPVETTAPEEQTAQAAVYTHVDVRL